MMSYKRMMSMEKRRKHLVVSLSDVLSRLCHQNDQICVFDNIRSSFCSLGVFPLTIKQYLIRIAFYTGCTEESLIFSLIYIDRLGALDGRFMVTSYNVHRLVLTSILMAAKFYDDIHFKNSHYANVGGISVKEINILEKIFLNELNFDLHVGKKLYKWYRKCFDKAISKDRSLKPRSQIQPGNAVIAVPMSCSKLVTENPSTLETNTQSRNYAKYFSSARQYQVGARHVDIPNESVPGDLNNYCGIRSSQPSYIPVRCFVSELYNWQGTCRPVIGSV